MTPAPLTIPQASAAFDPTSGLVRVSYSGTLGADVTHQVYDWLDLLYEAIGTEAIVGQIFDFRGVTTFEEENLQAARRVSKMANLRVNTSHFPVALIVKNFYQQEILRSAMRISPDHERKQIVWTEDEAAAYIRRWHEKHLSTAK